MSSLPESRYKIPSLERFFNRVVKFIFYYRLAFVILFLLIIIVLIVSISNSDNMNAFKNAALILTGGSIIIGIFYTIINYEHNYYKSQNDNKLSKQILSFNVAFEWHKPNIVENLKTTKVLYEKNKHLILENKASEFSELLESDEKARASLISIFNYLESVAVGVECGVLDKELIKRCFKGLYREYYNNYEFYIIYKRKKYNTPDALKSFTTLACEWNGS